MRPRGCGLGEGSGPKARPVRERPKGDSLHASVKSTSQKHRQCHMQMRAACTCCCAVPWGFEQMTVEGCRPTDKACKAAQDGAEVLGARRHQCVQQSDYQLTLQVQCLVADYNIQDLLQLLGVCLCSTQT